MSDNSEFQLRSDFITIENLLEWNVSNDHFDKIQGQLKSTGTKLLVGPRGSGKTHQMKVFQENAKSNSELPLCIYISFTKYLYLEPYLTKSTNAIQIFHSWVLAKIVLSCFDIIDNIDEFNNKLSENGFTFNIDELLNFIAQSERGLVDEQDINRYSELTIKKVSDFIDIFRVSKNRKRTVILFDDAALTLSQEFMVELFDIIRSFKSTTISPKASVYPGTTEYGPRFHVGHDGDEVTCWMNLSSPTYSIFMKSLIENRFSTILEHVPENILEIFKYASFGIPRAFISLIRNYMEADSGTQQSKYNHAIEKQSEFIKIEYLSLIKKMPQYKLVIEVGNEFFNKCVNLLTNVNKSINNSIQLTIGVDESSISSVKLFPRLKQLLYEAGLIYDLGSVSHGGSRTYDRFMIHTLFLLNEKAFSAKSRGFNPSNIVIKLKSKQEKHPVRKTILQIVNQKLLDELKLDFPPCLNCQTPRIAEEQLFCHNCGKELTKISIFNDCLKVPVAELSITEWQKLKMTENGYNCIEDFITKKDPASSLRQIYKIGKVKAEKISSAVDLFMDEFLS